MRSSHRPKRNVIRVLVADDHPVVREGLVSILNAKDTKVVGEASDGEEVCKLYDQLTPDILILDLRMPKKDGLQVVTELMSRTPKPRIIVMTTYEGEEDVRRALSAGAKGYVLKGTNRDKILETVRKVHEGLPALSPEVAAKLADSLTHPALSERELQVLKYMASGKSNKEIAQVIYVSEHTVKAHVKSILAKMDAIGRTEAIAIAIKRGLVRVT
jgi:two-component system, NarL family, response regulator